MKKNIIYSLVLFAVAVFSAQSQSVIGKWKTIDDATGKPKSIIEIYEKSGKIYGKVVEVLQDADKKRTCTECSGEDHNKPVLGMIIIKGLTKDGKEYSDGKILDPKNGKLYKCFITLEEKDKLKVRGFIGISL